jgi:hypothetical protein
MKEQLEARLVDLKRELEAGQKLLADLDLQRATTQSTLLRITCAVQVIEELLAADANSAGKAPTAISAAR